jgi:hypothetical protein
MMWVLATGDTVVAPYWKRSARATWRLCGAELLVDLVLLVVATAILIPLFHFRLLERWAHFGPPTHADVSSILKLMFVVLVFVFCFAVVYCFCMVIVRDFMLPAMALEEATIRTAWRRTREIFAVDSRECWRYLIIRIFLIIGCLILAYLVFIMVAVATALLLIGIYWLLAHMTSSETILFLMKILEFVVGIGLGLLELMVLIGITGFLLQGHATLFIGSRYEPLGNLIWPPAPPVASPPVGPGPVTPGPGGVPPVGGQDDWLTAMG